MYIIKEMNVIRDTLEDIKIIEDAYITMRRGRQHVKKEKERSKRRRKRKKQCEKRGEKYYESEESTSEQEEEYFMARQKIMLDKIPTRAEAIANARKKGKRCVLVKGEIVSNSGSEEEYEKCDHKYTLKSKGYKT